MIRAGAVSTLVALVALAGGAWAEEGTHPFSVHDMLAMQRVSDPRVSPDGTLVATHRMMLRFMKASSPLYPELA